MIEEGPIHGQKNSNISHQILINSPVVTFLWRREKDWIIDYISQNVENVLGYKYEQLISQRVLLTKIIHPQDLEICTNEVNLISNTGTGHGIHRPLRIRKMNGQYIWVKLHTQIRKKENDVLWCEGVMYDITQDMHREEELQNDIEESRLKTLQYKTFVNSSFEGIMISENGIGVECNAKALEMFGYTLEEAEGLPAVSVITEEYRDLVIKNIREDYTRPYNVVAVRKDGSQFEAEIQGKNFVQGDRVLRITAIRDITEKKKSEAALNKSREELYKSNQILQQRTNFLKTVNEFTHELAHFKTINEVTSYIRDITMAKFGFEDCMVFMCDKVTQELIVEGRASKNKQILKKGQGIVGAAVQEGKPVVVKDTSKDSRYVVDHEVRYSELAVPIICDGEVLGVIDSEHLKKDYFTEEHIEVLSTIANISGARIKQIESQKALLESELKHRLIFEKAKDSIFLLKEGLFADCNKVTLKMFGCEKKEDIVGESPAKFSPELQPDGRDSNTKAEEKIQLAYDGKPQTFYWLHQKLDGTTFDAEVSLNRFCMNDEMFLQAVVRDITERKTMELTLKKSEKLYRNLIELTSTVAWEIDVNTDQFTFMSPQIEEVSGYTPDKWADLDFWEATIHPDDRAEAVNYCSNAAASGKNHSFEYRMVRADGEIVWINKVVSVVKRNDEVVRLRGYFLDVTEQKMSERIKEEYTQKLRDKVTELEEAKENYRKLFDENRVSLLEEDFTESYNRIQGLKEQGVEDFLEYVKAHPEFINECIRAIKVVQVNKASVELFKANSKEHLVQSTGQIKTDSTPGHYTRIFNEIFKDQTEIISETSFRDLNGQIIYGIEKLHLSIDQKLGSITANISIINITERVIVEQKLQEQNEHLITITEALSEKNKMLNDSRFRFENLFEQNPISVWEEDVSETIALIRSLKMDSSDVMDYLDMNPHFVEKCARSIKILNVNTYTLKLFGIESKNELYNILIESFNQKSFDAFKAGLVSLHKGEKKFSKETQYRKKNGDIIQAILKLVLINDEGTAIISIIDITPLKKTQKALLQAKERAEENETHFRTIFDTYIDPVSISRMSDSKLVRINKGFTNKIGYTEADVLGKTAIELGIWVDVEARQRTIEEVKRIGFVHGVEMELRLRNGEIRTELLSLRKFTIKDEAYVLVVSHDITLRKRTEDELLNKQKELIDAKERAEEADRLKTEFLNNLSHEIRTPLNGIIGFSSFLSDEFLSDELRNQYVKIIQSSGGQLVRVIDEILEISKLEKNQLVPQNVEVDVDRLLFDLYSIFKLKAEEKGISLSLKSDLEIDVHRIITDETKLNKILSNLLQNALKFTSKGGIDFGYKVVGGFIEFYVKDTGIGIEINKQQRVFERFAQEDKSIAPTYGGLGLGLSIVKEHVDLLGGTINLVSSKGKGSTFLVSLPYEPVEYTKVVALEEPEKSVDNNAGAIRILVVEDDEVSSRLMIRLIEKLLVNCVVIHAVDGQQAVDFVKQFETFDLILMDINIPVINGYQATAEIQEINPNIPIIAQTAYSTTEDIKRIEDAGCMDFISKPIKPTLLKALFEKYLPENIS
ncbi:PAS domain S-box protein [bacterium SCSIO 12643]|nr:PAS domain S-box protein [bacterium SCSIO 12643]